MSCPERDHRHQCCGRLNFLVPGNIHDLVHLSGHLDLFDGHELRSHILEQCFAFDNVRDALFDDDNVARDPFVIFGRLQHCLCCDHQLFCHSFKPCSNKLFDCGSVIKSPELCWPLQLFNRGIIPKHLERGSDQQLSRGSQQHFSQLTNS